MQEALRRYYAIIRPRSSMFLCALWNFGVVLLLMMISRLIFYALNINLFPNTTAAGLLRLCYGGLRFDLSTAIYLNLPYFLLMLLPFGFRHGEKYQLVAKIIYLIVNSLILIANCIDTIYFRFTLRRTTATVFREFENEGNMLGLALQFLVDYWYMALIWIALVVLLVLLYRRPQRATLYADMPFRLIYFGHGLVLLLLSATLMVIGARGGFRHGNRPIDMSNANAYIREPIEATIVLNTPFSVLRSAGFSSLPEVHYFATEAELAQHFNPVQQVGDSTRSMRRLNVVVLIVESFSREFISAYNRPPFSPNYRGYTPFVDSLVDNSLCFRYAYSNGRKSIDAMPSILASIPRMGEPYILSEYSSNRINSLASELRSQGYSTAFFHGAPNGSMGFDAFANIAGFEHYYGMTEYGNNAHYDGWWAIWDEEFLQYFANKLAQMPQPFCAALFTASSHHPFRVPERYRDTFPEGPQPLHRPIGYTDHALRRFFATASQQPWFDSTLFVLTADHTNQIQYPEYATMAGYYAVPIVFHRPNGELRGMRNELAQQIDIMPSVLGYLNCPKPFVAFGRNLFDGQTQPWVLNYNNGAYQFFADTLLAISDGERLTALYRYQTDVMLRENLLGQHPQQEADMLRQTQAIIQQYNNRMRSNTLTVVER